MSHESERRPGGATGATPSSLTTTGHGSAPHEPSAWLRERCARIAANPKVQGALAGGGSVLVPLFSSAFGPGSAEDQTCDRCRAYVADTRQLVFFRMPAGVDRLAVAGGLCVPCAALEGWSE